MTLHSIRPLLLKFTLALTLLFGFGRVSVGVEPPAATAAKIGKAYKLAKAGKARGFVSLLAIADNDPKLEVDQSEAAYDDLMLLLRDHPKEWFDALSKSEFERTKKVVGELGIPGAVFCCSLLPLPG